MLTDAGDVLRAFLDLENHKFDFAINGISVCVCVCVCVCARACALSLLSFFLLQQPLCRFLTL
jgi:hypothetical protein